jgi:hypothetical protein
MSLQQIHRQKDSNASIRAHATQQAIARLAQFIIRRHTCYGSAHVTNESNQMLLAMAKVTRSQQNQTESLSPQKNKFKNSLGVHKLYWKYYIVVCKKSLFNQELGQRPLGLGS